MLKFSAQQSVYNATTVHMGQFLSFFSFLFTQMFFVWELFEQKFSDIKGWQRKKEKHVSVLFYVLQVMNK